MCLSLFKRKNTQLLSISSIRSAGNIRFRQPDEVDRCSTGVGKNTLVQGSKERTGGPELYIPLCAGIITTCVNIKFPQTTRLLIATQLEVFEIY